MSDYFDCIAFKKRNDKNIPVRLGSAKKRDDGGFQVYLDAIPAPNDGTYSFAILPQKPREDVPRRGRSDDDSDVPF